MYEVLRYEKPLEDTLLESQCRVHKALRQGRSWDEDDDCQWQRLYEALRQGRLWDEEDNDRWCRLYEALGHSRSRDGGYDERRCDVCNEEHIDDNGEETEAKTKNGGLGLEQEMEGNTSLRGDSHREETRAKMHVQVILSDWPTNQEPTTVTSMGFGQDMGFRVNDWALEGDDFPWTHQPPGRLPWPTSFDTGPQSSIRLPGPGQLLLFNPWRQDEAIASHNMIDCPQSDISAYPREPSGAILPDIPESSLDHWTQQ